ncbi:hypothetical protein A1O1_08400 [Capronia coronata CBS 617.96]|uniref:Uncharacterized protein n=1 Tax=Capronia coronata CBS 617.96 TaxID=1182541 RepID=W9XJ69_9EURO|nr:uncharacterized protein A1O1_08400 [Capronia coronata CBS 617.96]EXJ80258.1 hypothetical protein A1O1_08400 [Capronia coronata CBS 617.96]
MFSGGLWGAVASGGLSLSEQERNPPAKPIALEFPGYIPPRGDSPLTRKHIEALCKDLVSIRRPSDIQDSHFAHLNIDLEEDISLAELVPEKHFESRPFLYDADLTAMLNELEVDNEDAYREILRLPPLEGRKKPRLAYSRNFFGSLEDMSRYWDDSRDQYYEVEANEADHPATKPSILRPSILTAQAGKDEDTEINDVAAQQRALETGPDTTASISGIPSEGHTIKVPTRPKLKPVYKGHRLGNGEQMNPGTRVGAVRNLLKMAVHKFTCRDYEVNPRERLRIGNVNLPSTYYNFCVTKLPAEMKLARARMVEGPLMAVHCRNEVRFKSRDDLLGPASDFVGEKYDLFREVAGMLMVAQQRAREGRKLSAEPGEHQWWAIKPRWGGGETRWGQLANEVYEDDDPSWSPEERRLQMEKRKKEEEERQQAEAASLANLEHLQPEDLMSRQLASGERPKKKKRSGENGGPSNGKAEYREGRRLMYTQPVRRKWYQEWLKIRPNGPTWDEKIIYKRVGMRSREHGGDGWDNIYMVSAVNHHACILRLCVHDDYLQWLEMEQTKEDHPEQQAHDSPCENTRHEHILYMRRSHWYDLFDAQQRKEFLVGIWRIMCWLNRDEVPPGEYEKMEQLRRDQEKDDGDHKMEV